jgi:hypothetical protein
MRKVPMPHSISRLKKYPDFPDRAACIGKGGRRGTETELERIDRVLVEIRAKRLSGAQISAKV